ncbi:MAG: DUF4494 domain-containing protein [Prolixibacteraceae bacterium]|jgi:hypothetical protein|nr:DUF4494 domain-containing protein [Prolixibacteraceae bacterium]
MQTWFECKVKYIKIDEDGRERKVSENYLVDAVSFTDAETRIIKEMESNIRGEFTVENIKKSNIIEIFPHEDGEWWYKAKIGLITIDEKAGKEKKINNYFLVAASDLKQAMLRLEDALSYILVPYQTTALTLSTIADVFPYFSEEKSNGIPSNLKPLAEVQNFPEEVYPAEEEEEER